MGRDGDDRSLPGVLDAHFEARLEDIHTATAGRVESYDAGEQTVDVVPMVNRSLRRRDSSRAREELPTLRAVPVVFPGSGVYFVRWPISAGDEGVIFCAERDLAMWLETAERSDPPDVRSHHLAHAFFVPGLRSRPGVAALSAPSGTAMEIGRVGGSSIKLNPDGTIDVGGAIALALATLVDAELEKIEATLATGTAGGDPVVFGTPYVAASVAATKARGL